MSESMEELDRAVWEALGFGGKWFPPDVPTCGPGWTVEIKTIADPAKPGWQLFGSFPPVSRDWNLAMWALGRATEKEEFAVQFDVDDGIDEETGWTCYIGAGSYANIQESGPVAVCKAIFGFLQWKKNQSK